MRIMERLYVHLCIYVSLCLVNSFNGAIAEDVSRCDQYLWKDPFVNLHIESSLFTGVAETLI